MIGNALTQSLYMHWMKRKLRPDTVYSIGENQKPDLKKLAVSEFIIAAAALPDFYLKRKGQTVISAFVPEKEIFIGKVQRTLLLSDYIILPDISAAKNVAKDFELDGLYTGRIITGSSDDIIRKITGGIETEGITLRDNRKKVIVYAGSLAQNGLTSSLLNLLSQADREDTDIRITYREQSLKDFPERICKIPERFMKVPVSAGTAFTLGELLCYILYFKLGVQQKYIVNKLDRLYEREWDRLFGADKFDCAVHFTGYEYGMINLFRSFPGKRVIYVHNNMKEEIRLRKNQHEPTLRRAYSQFECTALVTEDMRESAMEISGGKGNMTVAENCHNWKAVLEKSREPLAFQPETDSTVTCAELEEILNSSSVKFITIGRYSAEKAHTRLIDAFKDYCKDYSDTILIIIGGRGELYEQTVSYAEACGVNAVLIRSMENPMPVLKRCDLFILPSLYEGLGLVILEADTLGIPVIATDIPGPRGFMKTYGGTLVPDSREGITQGMKQFRQGKIKPMQVDYERYNREAVNKFYEII